MFWHAERSVTSFRENGVVCTVCISVSAGESICVATVLLRGRLHCVATETLDLEGAGGSVEDRLLRMPVTPWISGAN
jgi:hypothetical protein